ncbi:HAD family hydrolase [Paenibacillus sambharensis]|uniref:HAD family hydrolase n=1 Tax=Paenibacillus sambharensis TaxID=1803190 RepID=A0A2W1LRW8_9BACL|nr:HD domain-containing protein [Paenibacillus sambharensis]PZD97234.1 HAD family hydrolase [Paenibacillus sambharensis]
MKVYDSLFIPNFTGDLRNDVNEFLIRNGHGETAEHCLKVGEESERIAVKFNEPADLALYAGYLHDISAVYPNEIRIEIARSLGIQVLPEEEIFPMIIHQKLSRQMSIDIFKITNEDVLNAVGCHTTLRKESTKLDRVLFVADKIAWDQKGSPPYLNELLAKLEVSLEHAAFEYISYLWSQREKLKVLHPWLADAYFELKTICE